MTVEELIADAERQGYVEYRYGGVCGRCYYYMYHPMGFYQGHEELRWAMCPTCGAKNYARPVPWMTRASKPRLRPPVSVRIEHR